MVLRLVSWRGTRNDPKNSSLACARRLSSHVIVDGAIGRSAAAPPELLSCRSAFWLTLNNRVCTLCVRTSGRGRWRGVFLGRSEGCSSLNRGGRPAPVLLLSVEPSTCKARNLQNGGNYLGALMCIFAAAPRRMCAASVLPYFYSQSRALVNPRKPENEELLINKQQQNSKSL